MLKSKTRARGALQAVGSMCPAVETRPHFILRQSPPIGALHFLGSCQLQPRRAAPQSPQRSQSQTQTRKLPQQRQRLNWFLKAAIRSLGRDES
eukprot:224630-Amphidinium_carterae.2